MLVIQYGNTIRGNFDICTQSMSKDYCCEFESYEFNGSCHLVMELSPTAENWGVSPTTVLINRYFFKTMLIP